MLVSGDASCISGMKRKLAPPGIGLAAIVAVGLFIIGAIVLAGLIIFEEETHLPWWDDARREAKSPNP